jgi:hypothetical protein
MQELKVYATVDMNGQLRATLPMVQLNAHGVVE